MYEIRVLIDVEFDNWPDADRSHEFVLYNDNQLVHPKCISDIYFHITHCYLGEGIMKKSNEAWEAFKLTEPELPSKAINHVDFIIYLNKMLEGVKAAWNLDKDFKTMKELKLVHCRGPYILTPGSTFYADSD